VGQWAEQEHIAYTTYTDLTQKADVLALIEQEVQRANRELPEGARVKKFVLLYKELDPDDEELTRTRKVRRKFVAEKYKTIVRGLYSGRDYVSVEGTIRYQDGTEATIQTDLPVITVTEGVPEVAEVAPEAAEVALEAAERTPEAAECTAAATKRTREEKHTSEAKCSTSATSEEEVS
jgi:hypothetical protein